MEVVEVGSEDPKVDDVNNEVDVEDCEVVRQSGPEQLETLISAQFQNFSAPLLFVRGSTTSSGQEPNAGCHQALASPPNLADIHDCVELLLK
jgi:hypothetical protein